MINRLDNIEYIGNLDHSKVELLEPPYSKFCGYIDNVNKVSLEVKDQTYTVNCVTSAAGGHGGVMLEKRNQDHWGFSEMMIYFQQGKT